MDYCTRCGKGIDEWEQQYYNSLTICGNCYSTRAGGAKKFACARCSVMLDEKDADLSLGKVFCKKCFVEEKRIIDEETCAKCNKRIKGRKFQRQDGRYLCEKCMGGSGGMRLGIGGGNENTCSGCGDELRAGWLEIGDKRLCNKCAMEGKGGKKGDQESEEAGGRGEEGEAGGDKGKGRNLGSKIRKLLRKG
ncbi:MAG: LIM domain-containing protein [Candidatus Micrarchaeota archaeon]|nr:LIM domain-containing protein [Candidatus Micrarchaeota archaeon]